MELRIDSIGLLCVVRNPLQEHIHPIYERLNRLRIDSIGLLSAPKEIKQTHIHPVFSEFNKLRIDNIGFFGVDAKQYKQKRAYIVVVNKIQ